MNVRKVNPLFGDAKNVLFEYSGANFKILIGKERKKTIGHDKVTINLIKSGLWFSSIFRKLRKVIRIIISVQDISVSVKLRMLLI